LTQTHSKALPHEIAYRIEMVQNDISASGSCGIDDDDGNSVRLDLIDRLCAAQWVEILIERLREWRVTVNKSFMAGKACDQDSKHERSDREYDDASTA
jgi:hypothetical protein